MLKLSGGFLMVLALSVLGAGCAGGFKHFISADGDRLLDKNREIRFVSFNIPNLHYVEDDWQFDRASSLRLPDAFEIRDALESIEQLGGQVVRIYTLSVRRPDDPPEVPRHVLGPGRFNEEAFRTLDRVLQIANDVGIRLIIPFVDNWHWWGGRAEYAAFRGKPPEAFWRDPQIIADFKKTIQYLINRKNVYTGKRYREDKAILAWETGNELESPDDWTREITAYIKSLDPNHLVIDGRHSTRVREASLADENVDIVTTHHYTPARQMVRDIRWSKRLARGKKPYVVGEFGFIPTAGIDSVLQTVISEQVAGAMIWSLRFHNRDGGFYWHSESGRWVSYHWPGFASGAPVDERNMFRLLREKAYAIRGKTPPSQHKPKRPVLLPVQHPAAITWRGVAGAASYRVERASRKSGPWQTVAAAVSDAVFPYRPLFADSTAAINEHYYYRVRAENAAGLSKPSNIVGPVRVTSLFLVDELISLERIDVRHGNLKIISTHAKEAKQDRSRLRGGAGSEVVYTLPGALTSFDMYAFFPGELVHFAFYASLDKIEWARVEARVEIIGKGREVSTAFVPVRYRISAFPAGTKSIKIVYQTTAEIARVEVRHRPAVFFSAVDE